MADSASTTATRYELRHKPKAHFERRATAAMETHLPKPDWSVRQKLALTARMLAARGARLGACGADHGRGRGAGHHVDGPLRPRASRRSRPATSFWWTRISTSCGATAWPTPRTASTCGSTGRGRTSTASCTRTRRIARRCPCSACRCARRTWTPPCSTKTAPGWRRGRARPSATRRASLISEALGRRTPSCWPTTDARGGTDGGGGGNPGAHDRAAARLQLMAMAAGTVRELAPDAARQAHNYRLKPALLSATVPLLRPAGARGAPECLDEES